MTARSVDLGWEDLRALGAATTDPVSGARDWRALMATVPFDAINENTQRVLPAIFRNLRDIPDLPERDRMRGAFKYVWSRNTEMLHGIRPVLAAFAEQRVGHRVLKGAAVQVVCDSLGSRTMGDVDVLVASADVDRACAILDEHGFRRGTHAVCDGHSDSDHHGALNFNKGSCHVDVHVAEYKAPTRLLTAMMTAPARYGRVAGLALAVPPPELLLLHAAVHGCLASGPTDFVQAVVDVATLLPRCDRPALVHAAQRTATLPQLLELDAAVADVGAEPLSIDVPRSARVRALIGAGAARAGDAVAGSSTVAHRIRIRQRGTPALERVTQEFGGRPRSYRAWLRGGQFASAERVVVRAAGGFLPPPKQVWTSGTTAHPFDHPETAGLTASPVARHTLDWRFRVRLPGPQPWLRLSLDSAALDRLDTFVFCNGRPVTHVFAGDPGSRIITMRDVPASAEFSLRPLWDVCTECYQGLDDLSVRIDLGDDAR